MVVDVQEVFYDGGTLAFGTGVDVATGETVRFAGEPRYLRDIAEALGIGEVVEAEVPEWAILGGSV